MNSLRRLDLTLPSTNITPPSGSTPITKLQKRHPKDDAQFAAAPGAPAHSPFNRPMLPSPDPIHAVTHPQKLQPTTHADRLTRILNAKEAQNQPATTETQPKTIEGLLFDILNSSEEHKKFALQNTAQMRSIFSEHLSKAESEHFKTIKAIDEKKTHLQTNDFWQDMTICLLSSVQIVGGGLMIASPTESARNLGYTLLFTGSATLAAQALKSLGYSETLTGAIALIASSIGLIAGGLGFQSTDRTHLANKIFDIASLTQTLMSSVMQMNTASIQYDIDELRAKRELHEGDKVILSQKIEDNLNRFKATANLDKQINQASSDFLRNRADIHRGILAAGLGA
ncbi:MAG: hypothetical protein K9M07_00780 [Simkaniaceae bacterium]|nr:hypothetical protein [Simkaniaceae bacterium]